MHSQLIVATLVECHLPCHPRHHAWLLISCKMDSVQYHGCLDLRLSSPAKLEGSDTVILHVQGGSSSLARLDSSAVPGLYRKYGLEDAPQPGGQEAGAREEEGVAPEANGVDTQGGSAAFRRHLSAAERKALKKVPTFTRACSST